MNAALATWDGRIAPVFDVVGQIQLLAIELGRVVSEAEESMEGLTPQQKALRLAELGVDLLVCGAISKPLQTMVEAYGIQVLPFVTGDLTSVIRALLQGRLSDRSFAMPGFWRGQRRRRGSTRGHGEEERAMEGTSGSGGRGRSRENAGRGQPGGGRQGPQGRGFSRGAGGVCVCPSCGYEEVHERGIPCTQKRCPQCSSALVRR